MKIKTIFNPINLINSLPIHIKVGDELLLKKNGKTIKTILFLNKQTEMIGVIDVVDIETGEVLAENYHITEIEYLCNRAISKKKGFLLDTTAYELTAVYRPK